MAAQRRGIGLACEAWVTSRVVLPRDWGQGNISTSSSGVAEQLSQEVRGPILGRSNSWVPKSVHLIPLKKEMTIVTPTHLAHLEKHRGVLERLLVTAMVIISKRSFALGPVVHILLEHLSINGTHGKVLVCGRPTDLWMQVPDPAFGGLR